MRRIFPLLDQASGLFAAGRYAEAVPLLEKILVEDPHNLDAALRAATAYSSLGQDARALAMFQKAAEIAPNSSDVRTYLALHYARGKDWPRAVPLLEQVVAESPDRLPALEALAAIRVRQGRIDDAFALRQRIYAQRDPTPAELVELGSMAMDLGRRRSRPRPSSGRARSRGPRSRTTSSWASCISPTGNSRRRGTRSTACRPRAPAIRWRSSSARR